MWNKLKLAIVQKSSIKSKACYHPEINYMFKTTTETLEEDLKYVESDNKDNRTTLLTLFRCRYC